MDLSVASSLHGNKITTDKDLKHSLKSETLRSLLCMLVLVTKEITRIHGIHPWKDGMAYDKTHATGTYHRKTRHGMNLLNA